jgi:hypothetical protein
LNTELIPGVLAATGGSAMLGGILLHEHRRDEAMRASREHLGLRFPAVNDDRKQLTPKDSEFVTKQSAYQMIFAGLEKKD